MSPAEPGEETQISYSIRFKSWAVICYPLKEIPHTLSQPASPVRQGWSQQWAQTFIFGRFGNGEGLQDLFLLSCCHSAIETAVAGKGRLCLMANYSVFWNPIMKELMTVLNYTHGPFIFLKAEKL